MELYSFVRSRVGMDINSHALSHHCHANSVPNINQHPSLMLNPLRFNALIPPFERQ